MKEFVSKTINEGSADLDKFPASKVHQLAKKYESSKAMARHIKQVAGEMQTTQIHLMRHQHTELPHGKYKKQKPQAKPRPTQNKNTDQRPASYNKKTVDPSRKIDAANVEIPLTWKVLLFPTKKCQCKGCHNIGHFTSLCFIKRSTNASLPQAPESKGTSADCQHNPGIRQPVRFRRLR